MRERDHGLYRGKKNPCLLRASSFGQRKKRVEKKRMGTTLLQK